MAEVLEANERRIALIYKSDLTSLKKFSTQTIIYGLSTILGRFLNYLLTPLHTNVNVFSEDQYGIINDLYSYVAFLIVLLTYGMETAYFRLSAKKDADHKKIFSTITSLIIISSFAFIILSSVFSQPIADWLKYPKNNEFVIWFAFIVGLDAISSIPLAKLRKENKACGFAMVNIISIFTNIGLNLFFLAYCLPLYKAGKTNVIIDLFYNPSFGVSYVFIANLVASLLKFILLVPGFWGQFKIDKEILKQAFPFALPLLVVGLAGMVNETLDRILLRRMLFNSLGEIKANTIVGIYSACYKLSIIITLFIQAFRYAAEPFFFSVSEDKNSPKTYAAIMNYFVIVCSFIFLGTMLFIDYIKYFIRNEVFWEGLKIVPILLFANIFLGIYYNLSIWYKLTDKTRIGAYIALIGALITIVLNVILIPHYTYVGSAWTTLICYLTMCILSFILGQKHFHIPYPVLKIAFYLLFSLGLWFIGNTLKDYTIINALLINIILLFTFIGVVLKIEAKGFKSMKAFS